MTVLNNADIWSQDQFIFQVSNTGCGMCKTVFNQPSAHCISLSNPSAQLTFAVGELLPFSLVTCPTLCPIPIISEIQHLYDVLVV